MSLGSADAARGMTPLRRSPQSHRSHGSLHRRGAALDFSRVVCGMRDPNPRVQGRRHRSSARRRVDCNDRQVREAECRVSRTAALCALIV